MTKYLFLVVTIALAGLDFVNANEPGERELLRDALLQREKLSWELLQKKDVAGMRAFYPDDLVMISSDGSRYNRAKFLEAVPEVNLVKYAIEGKPEVAVLTPDTAVLTYMVTYTMSIKNAKSKVVTMMTSSTYARRNKEWVLVFTQETPAKSSQPPDFKGIWDGTYLDDQGESGKGEYQFHDEKDGRLEVTVSWADQKMTLKGARLGFDGVHLEGKDRDTTYRYMGRMEGQTLVLQYLSIEKDGKTGSGVSRLTRAKQ